MDEAVIQQLIKDTSADIVPELINLYSQDAHERINKIREAIIKHDITTLDFANKPRKV